MTPNEIFNTKSIAVTSGKGGTGKSIFSVTLAYTLAHLGFKTLLIDLDLYTGGATFFTISDYQIKIDMALQDVFIVDNEYEIRSNIIEPIKIPNPFCNDNLFIVPAISNQRKNRPELILLSRLYEPARFIKIVKRLIEKSVEEGFDYIILDTRGGSDFTSISTALAVDGFVFITEADKTSWDTGRLFFNTIDDLKEKMRDITCFGFIINKNVLPSEAIETFLKLEWGVPHLTTIPLDINTVKYFQLDKIPIVEDVSDSLSIGILTTIEKIFSISEWGTANQQQFKQLKNLSLVKQKEKRILKNKVRNMSRILQIMQFFTSSLLIVLITAFFFNNSFSLEVLILFSIISSVLVFVNILGIFFRKRLGLVKEYFENQL